VTQAEAIRKLSGYGVTSRHRLKKLIDSGDIEARGPEGLASGVRRFIARQHGPVR